MYNESLSNLNNWPGFSKWRPKNTNIFWNIDIRLTNIPWIEEICLWDEERGLEIGQITY